MWSKSDSLRLFEAIAEDRLLEVDAWIDRHVNTKRDLASLLMLLALMIGEITKDSVPVELHGGTWGIETDAPDGEPVRVAGQLVSVVLNGQKETATAILKTALEREPQHAADVLMVLIEICRTAMDAEVPDAGA